MINNPFHSQEGDAWYVWLRFAPFCCCAGLEGDQDGDVGLYAGEAGARRKHEVSMANVCIDSIRDSYSRRELQRIIMSNVIWRATKINLQAGE